MNKLYPEENMHDGAAYFIFLSMRKFIVKYFFLFNRYHPCKVVKALRQKEMQGEDELATETLIMKRKIKEQT